MTSQFLWFSYPCVFPILCSKQGVEVERLEKERLEKIELENKKVEESRNVEEIKMSDDIPAIEVYQHSFCFPL
jgi:hypothetical protein